MAKHQRQNISDDDYDAVEQQVAQLVESIDDIRYIPTGEFQGFELHSPEEGTDIWIGRIYIESYCAKCGAYFLMDPGGDYSVMVGGTEDWYECEE